MREMFYASIYAKRLVSMKSSYIVMLCYILILCSSYLLIECIKEEIVEEKYIFQRSLNDSQSKCFQMVHWEIIPVKYLYEHPLIL